MFIYLLVLILKNDPATFVVANEYNSSVKCEEVRKIVVNSKKDPEITMDNLKCLTVKIDGI